MARIVDMEHRRMPWLTVGEDVTGVKSARQALRQANLDWHVTQATTHAFHNGGYVPVEDTFTNVKIDKHGRAWPLGVVGSRYKVIQNEEMFSVLDEVANSGDAKYTAAGEIRNGQVVYITMQLPKGVKIPGDPHDAYLLARTSHDGSTALEITTVINRLFCTNQINSIFSTNRKKHGVYTVRHTKNSIVDADNVRSVLQIAYDEIALYESFADRSLNVTFTDMHFERYLEKVFPMPEGVTEKTAEELLTRGQKIARSRSLNNRERSWDAWLNKTRTMDNIKGTAFGAFQAVIETFDHLAVSDEKKRATQTLLSNDSDKKFRAFYLLGV